MQIIVIQRVIQLHDKHFVPFIDAAEIAAAIKRMAQQAAQDHAEEVPVFIGVLNGAFMVLSDFAKQYARPCEISFVKMASYAGTASTGNIKQLIGLNQNLEGRCVVIIEDIVDTGHTIEALAQLLAAQKVKQLKIATLFFKPEAYTKNIPLNYVGFEIPNKFIVGFGLDYNGLGRNLPEIYQLQ